MITVQLHNLLFNAFHGIHEEEKILGNEYVVDASMEFDEAKEAILHISNTINYVTVYNIIKKRMDVPTPLLETLVMETGNEIHNEFPGLKSISISIKKMHLPIEGMQGSAIVKWHKEF
ncbi:MAG TPA: dihydroneopterin aldolase [Hanamia sp.]|nr:dihydroneopterin aldolase [Hanamia sp.]